MKASQECYDCLARLLYQAAELATDKPELRATVKEEGLKLLDREFSIDKTSIAVATLLHRLVRSLTGNDDPYFRIKQAELDTAADVLQALGEQPPADLRGCLIHAVRGNSIDFFKHPKRVMKDMTSAVEFVLDDAAPLQERLGAAKGILYLADNAGEVPFDIPLVSLLGAWAPVTYVVKESPVQDDITLADLERFELRGRLPRVISTGTDTPGVDMEMASSEFKVEFERADIVLAKGMGYWETLSELPAEGKVLHLLKAKCRPVANSLVVPLNSYVASLR